MPVQRLSEREKLVRKALKLYNQGRTYKQVGEVMGISLYKAWRLCNTDRYNELCRDSNARYRARGYTCLVDTP